MPEMQRSMHSVQRRGTETVHNGALQPTRTPNIEAGMTRYPLQRYPVPEPGYFGVLRSPSTFPGPPSSLSPSLVSLSVSLHPRRLLPALVLKFRPSGRRAGQGRWRPTGKGEVEVDPARNGADRRRCRPGAADLEEDQCSRFPDASGGGLEYRACGGRGEGEGRPTRSGKRRRSSRLVRGSRSGSGDSFSSLKRQRLRRR